MKRYVVLILAIAMLASGCSKERPKTEQKSVNSAAASSKAAASAGDKTKDETAAAQDTNSNKESNSWGNAKVKMKQSGQGVPVLMYHSIAYEKNNPVRLPEENFKSQMKYLKENGYFTITLNELYNYLNNGKEIPEKAVVLTFDDGYEDNYKAAFPILKEYGFKATIFVITSYLDTGGEYLTSEEVKEMDKYGIDIESHTVAHDNLQELDYEKQLKTLKDSKAFLEKLLNKEVKYIAYPYGKYNKDTVRATKDAGYDMAFTTDGRWSDKSDGMYTLDRVYISGFFGMDVFKERISNPNYKSIN